MVLILNLFEYIESLIELLIKINAIRPKKELMINNQKLTFCIFCVKKVTRVLS